jgi:acyl carrier protein
VSTATALTEHEARLAALIIEALNLEMTPQEMDPDAPLYREGLGLDSIDILEIALVISKTYGVQLKADDADNVRIFGSLRNLNDHVQNHRAK